MKCLTVILFLISSTYAVEDSSKVPCDDDDKITTRPYLAMVGDISNRGRRYDVDHDSYIYEDDDRQEKNNDNLSTIENEKPPPISASRNIRSFDLYENLYDSYRHKNMKENKNNDPKSLLNDVRSRSSQSNAYDEDQQRRMFFSKIFSLFDNEKNDKRSGKHDDKMKRSKSHIDTFKAYPEIPSSGQNKHDSRGKSLKNKEIESVNDFYKSNIESLMIDRSKPYHPDDDENLAKRKKKNKGQAKRNYSRPERELSDSESFEIVEGQIQNDNVDEFVSESIIKNQNRENFNDDEISDSLLTSSTNSFVSSTASASDVDGEKQNTETSYLIRTPSFNYYQTGTTYAIPGGRRSMNNVDVTLSTVNVDRVASIENQDKHTVSDERDSISDPLNGDNIQESVTFNPEFKIITDEQSAQSDTVYDINMATNNSITNEQEPSNVIFENENNNQSFISDEMFPILNDFDDKNTRRLNYINVNNEIENPIQISTTREEIDTPKQELHVSKVYGEASLPNNAPLSARIKLDLLIQLPSQIDIGDEV